jgi:hypothetical protein
MKYLSIFIAKNSAAPFEAKIEFCPSAGASAFELKIPSDLVMRSAAG